MKSNRLNFLSDATPKHKSVHLNQLKLREQMHSETTTMHNKNKNNKGNLLSPNMARRNLTTKNLTISQANI